MGSSWHLVKSKHDRYRIVLVGLAVRFRIPKNVVTPRVVNVCKSEHCKRGVYAYMSRFGNGSKFEDWPLQQRQFASAVWAQDAIVGAVQIMASSATPHLNAVGLPLETTLWQLEAQRFSVL